MIDKAQERITFGVETSRILEILTSEIYDSPTAFLRENVQNAYDAILMRCTAQGLLLTERRIEITINEGHVTVLDDGIGMSEDVFRNNFWKAGSSGKKTELAQRSGVIGTFGIGAMANFGVCDSLRVESRSIDSEATIITSVRRDDLDISAECIDLERVTDGRDPGTTVIGTFDPSNSLDEEAAIKYLRQYVRFLPVLVSVNGHSISQMDYEAALNRSLEDFDTIASRPISRGMFSGHLVVYMDGRGRVFTRLSHILLNGNPLTGEAIFRQDGGSTHGFRNFFGLAPIPVSGHYGLGGFVNLDILHPTAGREALSRESIKVVADLVDIIEAEISSDIANTGQADNNEAFQRYILSKGRIALAKNIGINVRPAEEMVPLGEVEEHEPEKTRHYYLGRDATILNQFANQQANLFHLSQANPRRTLQLKYLNQYTNLGEVPDETRVNEIPASELSLEEAVFLVRLRGVLLDDYLMSDCDASFADISHGVQFHLESRQETLHISIARDFPAVGLVIECYKTSRDVFDGFVKDFVRQHLYPHIRNYVPSSTKQGSDALVQRLKANKEMFRLQESDYGEIESLLTDYLSGKTEFSEVLRNAGRRMPSQWQQVRNEQVGSVEDELPDLAFSPALGSTSDTFEARPPILRADVVSEMKVLTAGAAQSMLNDFPMFLAVSDRLARREGEFLHFPHTTKLIWGAHRIIYIFTDEIGEFSLYYDIELKTPLETDQTGGTMVPSTTIITKDRIYIPVPNMLEPAFRVADAPKEFFVRFDTIP